MFKVIDKFNFGENFKKWIKRLYTDQKISVQNNGSVSNRFTSERGIRHQPFTGRYKNFFKSIRSKFKFT